MNRRRSARSTKYRAIRRSRDAKGWNMMPAASEVKITRADGTVEIKPAVETKRRYDR